MIRAVFCLFQDFAPRDMLGFSFQAFAQIVKPAAIEQILPRVHQCPP
jgi:hypothetical protein